MQCCECGETTNNYNLICDAHKEDYDTEPKEKEDAPEEETK